MAQRSAEASAGGGVKQGFTNARRRWPWLDHAIRMWGHYGDVRGNELAGAVTYFGFLSFFPLLALTFSVLGFAVENGLFPDARGQVRDALEEYLPGLVGSGPGQIDVDEIASARRGAGIIGLLGLLYSGLGWVDGQREALRQVFVLPTRQGNLVVKKLTDLLVLLLLGGALLVSLAISSTASALTRQVLELVGLAEAGWAAIVLRVVAALLSIFVTTVILLILFTRLPGRKVAVREALEGAVLGAVVIQVLLLVAGRLLQGTTTNPLYGAFAIVVGLLVWINIVSRVVLLAACWAATDTRVAPTTEAELESPAVGARQPTDGAYGGDPQQGARPLGGAGHRSGGGRSGSPGPRGSGLREGAGRGPGRRSRRSSVLSMRNLAGVAALVVARRKAREAARR